MAFLYVYFVNEAISFTHETVCTYVHEIESSFFRQKCKKRDEIEYTFQDQF